MALEYELNRQKDHVARLMQREAALNFWRRSAGAVFGHMSGRHISCRSAEA